MMIQESLGIILSVTIAVLMLSMIWKDNVGFRWVSRLALGFNIAYHALSNLQSIERTVLNPMLKEGQFALIIPLILGLLLYTKLFKTTAWLYKYPMALMLGTGIGLVVVAQIRGQVIGQIGYTIDDIFSAPTSFDAFNAVIVLIGVVTVISYFLFTKEQTGVIGVSAKIGRLFMMSSLAIVFAGDFVNNIPFLTGIIKLIINDLVKRLILGM